MANKFYFSCCGMSNPDNKNRRARASSAKVSHDRARPSSGNSHKNTNKIDFIENMYGGVLTSKRYSKGPSKPTFLAEETQALVERGSGGWRTHKQKEELVEENLQLKRELNLLKEELTLQKGKTEQMRRRNSEFTKQLNLKFNKELYWSSGGPDMVRGVKQMYEQIKAKYEDKAHEYDLLTQEYVFSQAREQRLYADLLHDENQKLLKRLNEAKQEMQYAQHGTLSSAVEDSIDAYKKYKFELQQRNEALQQETTTLKEKVAVLAEELAARDQKISYLDKLLIERDNSQHAAWRRLKKVEKEKQDIAAQFADYRHDREEAATNYEARIKRLRDTLERQSEAEREIFRHELEEKGVRIAKLEKEIAYLTTLLSYWKPLDEVNHLVATSQDNRNPQDADYDREVLLEYSMGSTMIKYNSKQHTHHPNDDDYDTKSITVAKSRKGSGDNTRNNNVAELMTKSIDITKKEEKRKRTQITADKRNTEEGVKTRKVTHAEIADICETLKYRFIGFGVPIDRIRAHFDYDPDAAMPEDDDEEHWNATYLSMREVNRTLTNQLFGLNENDALLLSRYLIEDSPNDHVYADPNNENLRSVVKSIIKNLIGDYDATRNSAKTLKDARELMQRYQTNLQSALKVTAPKGLISKRKLLELFKGLGIEMSPEVQDYFLGKLAVKSASLSSLRYEILFQK